MITMAGRCNNCGHVSAISKECRIVNGGSGVIAGVDENEMVMAASKTGVVAGNDPSVASTNHRVYPPSSSELSRIKDMSLDHMQLIKELSAMLREQNVEIKELKTEVNYLKQCLAECTAREENLDVLPFTPVSSTCSSGMEELSSAELHEQQDIKPNKRRTRQAASKQPNSDPLESNQTKRQRTRITRANSEKEDKMQELSLVTADDPYYTCLGDYDPIKDEPVSENSNSHLEIPSWRIKTYSSWYSMEGTENMSDDIFQNRHLRLEQCEQKRKRWDLQRIRELKRVEYLKEGRNKHHQQKSNDDNKEELTTLLPSPSNIKAIEITDKLPVSAFGINLHIDKNPEKQKFFRSKWSNDGSNPPKECNMRELRSSGCSHFYDTI